MKKTILFTSILVLCGFMSIIYLNSCKPNPCVTRAVACLNGGTCHDGDCVCPTGYEGDSCQNSVNKKFDSYYACIRTRIINNVQVDDNDDTLRINAMPNSNFNIQYYSIRSPFEVIPAKVNNTTFTIPEYQLLDVVYSGNGSLNNGVLTMTVFRVWSTGSDKTTYVGYKFE
ncbi:MAG: calcium-binding EGF-like domain-containing protein [Chitinophagaceae bacterium]